MNHALHQDLLYFSSNLHTHDIKLSKAKKSLEKCNTLLSNANTNIASIKKASQIALDGLKSTNWSLTEDYFQEIGNIPNKVYEKFLTILNIHPSTQYCSISFNLIKNRMNAFQITDLNQNQIADMLYIYNNKQVFKNNKISEIVVDWISYALEYRLLKDKLAETKKYLPYLHEKIQKKLGKISAASKKKENIEKNIQDIKKYIENEKTLTWMSTETSGIVKRPLSELEGKNFSDDKNLFKPEGFNDLQIDCEVGYNDDFSARKSLEIPIMYENGEELGCCRLGYFCF
ncbi:hypothetical protein SteCoe_1805 [Stentor coeruleus]|uniref:Uncharacterized protein n=1 Tax=Stentor coeruleus TaxID=5963 RepID=A0A1R2D120_9CILI|nr:hypothetical protein SteCoe_1805 [Stentor coeruleus]